MNTKIYIRQINEFVIIDTGKLSAQALNACISYGVEKYLNQRVNLFVGKNKNNKSVTTAVIKEYAAYIAESISEERIILPRTKSLERKIASMSEEEKETYIHVLME